jgi:hypothetical protein
MLRFSDDAADRTGNRSILVMTINKEVAAWLPPRNIALRDPDAACTLNPARTSDPVRGRVEALLQRLIFVP